jgi:putative phosphoribosyl transferase
VKEKIAPFPNLSSAGGELAAAFPRDGISNDVVVLAIVSAGIPVAVEVAKHLESALDLIIIRRLLAPRGPGSQSCAVSVAGSLVLDADVPPIPVEPVKPLDYFLLDAIETLKRRSELCRGGRPALDVRGRNILLVDCGIRTGLTMQAAIGALRKLQPKRVIAAVPVASVEGRKITTDLADDFVCLATPDPFGNAAVWYKNFNRPPDESVAELLSIS